jgi:hypothetical protein
MSTVTTVFEDNVSGEMTLKFLVDGIEKTKYSFTTDGCITLYERNSAHSNSYEGFVEGLQLVGDWIKKIWVINRTSLQSQINSKITKFSVMSQYTKSGSLKSVFKLGKTKVINTIYDPEHKIITFNKRPTVTMCFKDFQNLFHYQQYMGKIMNLMNHSYEHLDNDLEDEV